MGDVDKVRIDFVCVENAGRSQIAAAFAERERENRGLTDVVDIHSGGTDPAEQPHEEVINAMSEAGIDISDQTPKYVVLDDLKESHFLITMGCSISKFNPSSYGVEYRAWDIENPAGKDSETVRNARDEIKTRVSELFDEIEKIAEERETETTNSSRVTERIKSVFRF